jgi:cytochrome c oxidase cbb3-type subunit 4
MDLNDARVVMMLICLVLFLGICAWAWSSRRRSDFEEAAHLPFADDEPGLAARGEKR